MHRLKMSTNFDFVDYFFEDALYLRFQGKLELFYLEFGITITVIL